MFAKHYMSLFAIISPPIAAQFGVGDPDVRWQSLGTGNIHDTFLITSAHHVPFVLQRLNTRVFPQPAHIVDTHLKVYQHLAAQPDFPLRLPAPIATPSGDWLVQDATGGYWRALVFLENTYAVEQPETLEQAQQAAQAVGIFLNGLADLSPTEITPALPGFHDSVQRLQHFEKAVKENRAKRIASVQSEINFVKKEADVFYIIQSLPFPERLVHTDPKISNLLFDKNTRAPVAVLDWDTVMPGVLPGDFGDMVRTLAATAPEDEADLNKVDLNVELFTALVNGIIPPLRAVLTELEIQHLVTGARWIILEQMMRFLTDYLNGDVYYKIKYAKHNLIRARNQVKLYQAVQKQEVHLLNIILQSI